MNLYNIYIICKTITLFNSIKEQFTPYIDKINHIQWIPSEFLKVTKDNQYDLLCSLNTRYNTLLKNKVSKLGCIAAHRKALLAIINNKTTNNIILEEDAILVNQLPEPPNQSCYLGGWIIPPQISKAGKVKINIDVKQNELNNIDYLNFKVLMAHSYFIKSIEESIDILQSTFKKIKNYDVHLTDNRFIKFFYYPHIFKQGKHTSDIDHKMNKNDIYTENYGLNIKLT